MSAITTKLPVIGVTLDVEPAGGFASSPWYALRQNYLDSIASAGGVPLALPYHVEHVDHYLSLCDGIVISGGGFDIDPALFGEEIRSSEVKLKPQRTAFEKALAEGAMARDMPLLGICGGEQLIAALGGGRLVQHIPDEYGNSITHSSVGGMRSHHQIAVEPDSLLGRITYQALSSYQRTVNSSHHQSIRGVGDGWVINARSEEGVIEGLENPALKFCLGVQWHPEYLESDADRGIYAALIAAALDH